MQLDMKTGNGAHAPIWYQEGKLGKVIDYCLNDVRVETKLFMKVMKTGRMATTYKPEGYEVRLPNVEGL